jgi:hypothetical protein
MPENQETPATPEPPKPVEFIRDRNEAEQARRNGKPVEVKAAEPAKPAGPRPEEHKPTGDTGDDEWHGKRPPRSWTREMNRLRENAARAEERLSIYKELGLTAARNLSSAVEVPATDPEPQRKDFATDAEYNRAAGRWDARQEAKKEVGKVTEQSERIAEVNAKIQIANENFKRDMATSLGEDWEAAAKEAAEDEEAPEFAPADHPGLMTLLGTSEVQVPIWIYLARHPKDMQRLLDSKDESADQIQLFRRLEGKAEIMYTAKQKKEAAQAAGTEKTGKTAATPQATDGQTAERDARKPRPSTEVAARGGSAPPEEPPIGSAAWMAKRNQAQFAR